MKSVQFTVFLDNFWFDSVRFNLLIKQANVYGGDQIKWWKWLLGYFNGIHFWVKSSVTKELLSFATFTFLLLTRSGVKREVLKRFIVLL